MKPVIGWKLLGRNNAIASTRLRGIIPCTLLKEAGWKSELYDPERPEKYGIVVFQKLYDTEHIGLAQQLKSRGARIIFDLCDNHFYNPSCEPQSDRRAAQAREMIKVADAISVSTPSLAAWIQEKKVHVIDDAPDPAPPGVGGFLGQACRLASRVFRRSKLRLVWFGISGLDIPAYGMIDVPKILPFLAELNKNCPLSLTIVSNSRSKYECYFSDAPVETCYIEWKNATINRILQQHDICVLPVSVNPFTICKSSNRVRLALSLGLAVIADAIPSYEEFSRYILVGNWRQNLERYAHDSLFRRRQAREGLKYVRRTYTPSRVTEQWGQLFQSLAD